MKKISQIGLVVLTIVLSAFLLIKLIDIAAYVLLYILENPSMALLGILGLLALLYIYYKLRDWYRRR